MRETVLQFGTGNFLRAFIDPFLDIMQRKGLYSGSAVIVSPTDSAAVEKINAQGGKYHLLLRGIENDAPFSEISEITSVSRAINPYRDFSGFLALAENKDLRFIVSNTTEAGIAFDDSCAFNDAPPSSFPAKLTRFLYERFSLGLPGFIIFPCELIDCNADRLIECVLKYIDLWSLSDTFRDWILKENRFCNTLVDRIVTGFPSDAASVFAEIGREDRLLDTAEPYHLWVIEGNYENEFPLQAAGINVIWTQNATPYKKMKVRILNGLHTSMVFPGLLANLETVADCMNDPQIARFAEHCLRNWILPTLDGSEDVLRFADAVKQRFMNPYLHHRLLSISLNSVSKFKVRVLPTLFDNIDRFGVIPKEFVLSLVCLIRYYKENEVNDDPLISEYIKETPFPEILKNAELWKWDLSILTETALTAESILSDKGIREALEWSIT